MTERMIERPLWTTTDVARALNVGVSSVKRWTDEGALKSVKTVGGHRRYTLTAVHDFAASRGFDTSTLPAPPPEPDAGGSEDFSSIRRDLLEALEHGDAWRARSLIAYNATIVRDRASFLDQVVAGALFTIGERWKDGSWSVDLEHRASYLIAEVLDRMRPTALPANDSLALLACPPDNLHDLPLRMIRLILEWNNWHTEYLGAAVPWSDLDRAVTRSTPGIVLLSARNPEEFDAPQFVELASRWTDAGTHVCVGGGWARGGGRRSERYLRFRTLRGFERWLCSSRGPDSEIHQDE